MAGGAARVILPSSWQPDPAKFLGLPEVTFSAAYQGHQNQGMGWVRSRFPSNNIITDTGTYTNFSFTPNEERTSFQIVAVGGADPAQDDIGLQMASALRQRVYFFNALRSPAAQSPAGSESQLLPDAQNLPEVLNTFQPNRTAYKSYVDHVRRVLPLVKWIDVVPTGNSSQIRVWNVDENTTRDDLPNPLSECGTGVGQVLAILYVVIRSAGDVICIDEPNSFLHPGAAKALMAILSEHQEHQYIIATHSPEIIVSSRPERLFMLGFAGEKTSMKQLDQSDIESARQMLDEIGSRFSDVFGADAVIWVEGPTEVECFPLLVAATGRHMPPGTMIAPLRSTGDLKGRHAKAFADIYRNLSSAGSI